MKILSNEQSNINETPSLTSQQKVQAEIQQEIAELDAGQGIEGEQVFAELRERAKQRESLFS